MTHMENLFNKNNTIIFVLILTLWRLYLSAELQLHPDEAYYWLWSRHPDIGYFDHSPLVAYFIWITTLFSKAELWVRLSGTIATLTISVLTWQLAIQLFRNTVVAAGSVMLFNVYPLTMLGLIIITPDIPVYLFWSLSIFIFWQIIRSNNFWLWYALGISFGLALLSKYTAILLLPCLFLYLVLTEDRRWLNTVHPYLSLLLACLVFFPVVYWNSQHDWISFTFQLDHGLGGEGYAFGRIAAYLGGQLLVVGPIVWLLGIYAAAACAISKSKEQLFLLLTAIPVILFFGASSLRKLAGPNWPVFAYFTISILVTKYFLDSTSKIRRSLWYIGILSSMLLSSIMTVHARFSVIPLASYSQELAVTDATNSFYGWRELAAELKKNPDMTFAVTPSHQLSAELTYYMDDKIFVHADEMVARPSQFNLWQRANGLTGKNGCYVLSVDDAPDYKQKNFASTKGIDSLVIKRNGIPVRSYQIIPGNNGFIPGFNGLNKGEAK